jgi:AAA domain
VPALIHLNGPPGIGKSTLAALYAQRHPGTLDLDIDSLHRLVGGWQDAVHDTHAILRPVARAMAATHLTGGRDVVLPQYLARIPEIEAFERVATEAGAAFVEVVLLDDRTPSIERFERRPADSEWERHNRRVVAEQGGVAMLGEMYDRLLAVVAQRPGAVVVRSELGAVEATYESLVTALPPSPAGSDPGVPRATGAWHDAEMAEQMRCPKCGAEKVTTIRLPRKVKPGEPPATQPGWRCLECDHQWPTPSPVH